MGRGDHRLAAAGFQISGHRTVVAVDAIELVSTTGGQIVFPLLGPVVVPSRYGAKYAGGVFHEQPTVMRVSRGLSAQLPFRLNCPPELVRLVLRAPKCIEMPARSARDQRERPATDFRILPASAESA